MDTLSQTNQHCETVLHESTIFYIEANEQIKNETLDCFRESFKTVFFANSLATSLRLFERNENKIDLLLIDIDKPMLHGLEFLKQIRKKGKNTPVLVLTSFEDTNFIKEVIKLKVTDYIIKPMRLEIAYEIISKTLENIKNKKLVEKQIHELLIYKEILDKENLVSETDLEGNITYVNDIFCEISGYTKKELLGKPHNIVRHPDASRLTYAKMWQTIKNKKIWRGKLKNRAKDGSSYYVHTTVFPILDKDKNIEKYVASRYLITEEDLNKDKLREYILKQEVKKRKHEKQLQEEFNDAVHAAKMENDKKMAKFIQGLNEQIKNLKDKNSDEKQKYLQLEKEYNQIVQKLQKLTSK